MSLARFAAAAVAASAIAGSTLAADLVPPQYLAPTPVFSWTGFNIGIDGGFGGGVINADTILFQPPIIIGGVTFSPGSVSALRTSNRTEGVIVGGQVGYNYQLPNNIVVGIESDAQWSDVKESEHETASTNPTLRFTDLRAGLDWFGTTRLRLGYALGRFLPYVTGGVSYGQVTASGSQRVPGAPGTVFGSASSTHAGWTAGAGAEYAVTAYISLKAEYLFVQLNGVSGSEVGFAPPVVGSFKIGTFGANIVRAGLNWRFGGFGGRPVFAAY
ncbi:MAG TPA: outer membrane beta-barrel protein [Verrucomicrobiae bacterium]|nr:outer membrane beta-barrel protein [Verrucomicrobiae bacterium]